MGTGGRAGPGGDHLACATENRRSDSGEPEASREGLVVPLGDRLQLGDEVEGRGAQLADAGDAETPELAVVVLGECFVLAILGFFCKQGDLTFHRGTVRGSGADIPDGDIDEVLGVRVDSSLGRGETGCDVRLQVVTVGVGQPLF